MDPLIFTLHLVWEQPGTLIGYTHKLEGGLVSSHVISCNVASSSAEALGEGPHHYVNIGRVHPPVLTHTPACGPHGTNAVSLVQIQVSLGGVNKILHVHK